MKKNNLFLVSIALTMTLASDSFAYFHLCKQTMVVQNVQTVEERARLQEIKAYYDSKVNLDILNFRGQEIQLVASNMKRRGAQYMLTNAAIDSLNSKHPGTNWTSNKKLIMDTLNEMEFAILKSYKPVDLADKRHDALPGVDGMTPMEFAQRIMESIDSHPVVGYEASHRYQQDGTSIGYCFGRGCYIDAILMRLGVDRDSIKKIWAVGPMSTGSTPWQFHIGHMVRLPDGNWVVLDNVPGRVLTAEQWAANFKRQNKDGMLRFYVTDSEKFTPSLGAYDNTQLGIGMNPKNDWYKGYFPNMFDWFRQTDDAGLAAFLGISALPPRPVPLNPTAADIAASNREEQLNAMLPPRDVPLSESQTGLMNVQPGGGIGKTTSGFFQKIKELFDRN